MTRSARIPNLSSFFRFEIVTDLTTTKVERIICLIALHVLTANVAARKATTAWEFHLDAWHRAGVEMSECQNRLH